MKLRRFGNYTVLLFIAFLVIATGCDQGEGYGGTSRITGKVVTKYYNDDYSAVIREAPAVDEQVFLLFGDNENVGDRVETSATGSFEFVYLQPGQYTVYFGSRDTTYTGEVPAVVSADVELQAGADKDLGTLYRIETLDFNDGSSRIYGVIRLINYKNSSVYPFLEVKDTSFAQEHEVYLRYGNHEFYDERIRTDYKGYFEFSNLIPGDYEIYTYSEDVTGATEKIPVIRNVSFTDDGEEIDLGTITIEQL
jgi:hypothetical protein